MRRRPAHRTGSEAGQATVEFLGILPAAIVAALVAWQLVLAGQATWLAGNAARVAARAQAVGRDPVAAARSALPSGLERNLRVVPAGDGSGRVTVHVRLPLLFGRVASPLTIAAGAAMEKQTR
jgi:pilus assembly protein CpaE